MRVRVGKVEKSGRRQEGREGKGREGKGGWKVQWKEEWNVGWKGGSKEEGAVVKMEREIMGQEVGNTTKGHMTTKKNKNMKSK